MGQANQGAGLLSQGLGPITGMGGMGDWEPSIFYLFGVIILEMIVFHVLGRMLK